MKSAALTAGWNVVGGGVIGAGKSTKPSKAPKSAKVDVLAAAKAFAASSWAPMASVRDFRATVAMGKVEFDSQMLALRDAGEIALYHTDWAPESVRAHYVEQGGVYYNGFAVR